ncbi:hypothetical protein [Vulcanisaeta sp. JCM 14467]|uniref:hypothetical protein n=1 Tax=Vulcanisaeta sp. JCM 14467 TaxID=1295370 RepID=UPI000AFA75DD|nr:hypothetical protein [Vulcanisaeta sp. JCM 14467]
MLYDTMRTEEKLILKEFRDFGVTVSLLNIDELSLDLNRVVMTWARSLLDP